MGGEGKEDAQQRRRGLTYGCKKLELFFSFFFFYISLVFFDMGLYMRRNGGGGGRSSTPRKSTGLVMRGAARC